jgi:hypothetical protein
MRMGVFRQRLPLLLILFFSREASPQQIAISTQLRSPSASVRARAFYDLVAAASKGQPRRSGWRGPRTDLLAARARAQEDLATSLIDLLQRENVIVADAPAHRAPLPKDFDGEGYYGDLSSTVAGLRDPRAIAALVGAMSGNGPIESAVADFGGVAVPAVIRELNNPNQYQRWSAVLVLRTMTSRKDELRLGSDATRSITRALLRVIQDRQTPLAREAAIQALMPMSGDDIRAVMESVAAADTTRGYSPKTASRYPAREAAQAWLAMHPGQR